jgi:hypothetical protein
MSKANVSEQEWETFLAIADRLGIPVRELMLQDVRFSELESAGHRLGRAVAQATTERLAFSRASRLTDPQPCPTCGRQCPLVKKHREFETLDGPIGLNEPICHCSACRRDFFPSASSVGTGSSKLQSGGD